jgi:hypothetical protein
MLNFLKNVWLGAGGWEIPVAWLVATVRSREPIFGTSQSRVMGPEGWIVAIVATTNHNDKSKEQSREDLAIITAVVTADCKKPTRYQSSQNIYDDPKLSAT